MSLIQPFRDYLDLHKRERHGIVILIILLILALVSLFLISAYVRPNLADQELLEKRVNRIAAARDSLSQARKLKAKELKEKKEVKPVKKKKESNYFSFDPNTISDKEWKLLGFNSGQIRTINNYKSKGGSFRRPSDLSKMYCISQKQYKEIEPFVSISSVSSGFAIERDSAKHRLAEAKTEIPLDININLADTEELMELKGIGSYYAGKIIEYRDGLGGYVSVEQLLEIWNFKQETYDQIKTQVHLGDELVKRINLNHCTKEELQAHPYISWSEAKALISYREQHGDFKDVEEIKNSHLITEELCQKIKPYLKLE